VREYPLLIIGGGLSGLAAGIRFARFGQKVLILEKHAKVGGLNSYYYRKGRLLETGLHAVTNYAPPEEKHAPLNLLLRQLKIPRRTLKLRQQQTSEILFPGRASLCFANDFNLLRTQVAKHFPASVKKFVRMLEALATYDPFTAAPKKSAKDFVSSFLQDRLLIDMLFCPLMFYGSSDENDMDLSQFVILFRSVFQEGLFRPIGTIKDILDLLLQQYRNFGGEIELSTGVKDILTDDNRISGVRTEAGEEIHCAYLISTAGLPETARLFGAPEPAPPFGAIHTDKGAGRLSFFESIAFYNKSAGQELPRDRTIIFYNLSETFCYRRPDDAVDLNSGVICFPHNFQESTPDEAIQMRVTHLANYDKWLAAYKDADKSFYPALKKEWTERSREALSKIIGNCRKNIVYEDSFTPVTIERYTSRVQGAVYGCPDKIKDGRTNFANMYIAGTDQGYLGIVGSMLSGVAMVNRHILNKV